jgi:hypothetical protein
MYATGVRLTLMACREAVPIAVRRLEVASVPGP